MAFERAWQAKMDGRSSSAGGPRVVPACLPDLRQLIDHRTESIGTVGTDRQWPVTTARFPRQSRLLQARDFRQVFANNQFRVANRHFLLLGLHQPQTGSRLGMVVAKKHIPQAVQRNRIKRLIRTSFRLNNRNPAQVDIVVLVKQGADRLDNPAINQSLDRLWRDLEKQCAVLA